MAKKKPDLEVIVTSTVETTLPLAFLTPLQGSLKELTPERSKKLRGSILKHGFYVPMFIWENPEDGLIYIIDGHSRRIVLLEMMDEGYSIPQLPVVFINASDVMDAKEKLALVSSQYGKVTEDGAAEFFKGFDLSNVSFDLPFMDFSPTLEADPDALPPQETVTVSEHERKKVDLDDYEKFEHKCPRCSHEWSDK